ncbi:MAG: DUF1549 domain-containing protein, partial [Verrucomicrobiales bacterium]|nr:DUF1549 domain-containing protein [Verrucomicrobiales bacterium]
MNSRVIVPMLLAAGFPAFSQEADRAGIEFFEKQIRPALVKHCYECHSVEEGKSKGGLRVDSKRALLQGGDTGPAIVPGNPHESLLLTSIHYSDPEFEMPPDGKLPAAVISDIEEWIEMGAPDPRVGAKPDDTPIASAIDIEEGRKFWAYQPPEKTPPPAVKNSDWPLSEIDRFTLAAMEKNNLTPAANARPATLVRRLYFNLTGLPPSPEEVMKWGRAIGTDLNQEAVAQLVDQLLASPRFGERWGQHWLDVARYADSTGGDSNNIFPYAWRYRDYVIDSFNADKPFDQFIVEQLAGDLLPADSDEPWAKNLVATGFLVIGQKLVGEEDDRKFAADLVDEQIDATTRAFLATTAACARCHDHKSDPIPQSDYYAMATFFQNTQPYYGLLDAQARQHTPLIDVTGMGLRPGREILTETEFAALKQEAADAAAQMDDVRSNIRGKGGEKVTRANLRRSRTQRSRTEAALAAYDEKGHPKHFVMGVQDRDEPVETRLLIRGELDKRGPVVEPGFLQVASQNQPDFFKGSGRLDLAN